MTGPTFKVSSDLDLVLNQILNGAFENVDELPTDGLVRGRVVFYNGNLNVYNGEEWIQISGVSPSGEVIDTWNDEPASDKAPSERLVRNALDDLEDAIAEITTEDSVEQYDFEEPQTEWNITHTKGRLVLVQCYDSFGKMINGEVNQDVSGGTVTIVYNVPMMGSALIL